MTEGDYEKAKRDLAERLFQLRLQAGYAAAKDFAAVLGWKPSKVSKIENGKQLPSDADMSQWHHAVDAAPELITQAQAELRDLRLAAANWQRQLRSGHRARQDRDAREEGASSVIRAVDLLAVPGLLQTPACARRILMTQADLHDVPADDVDAAVRARMKRQQVLYDDDKTIEILTTEAALGMGPFTKAEKLEQIDRLVSVVGLQNVRFGVIPRFTELPNLLLHGWWIVDDEVVVELAHAEDRLTDPDIVAFYGRLTDRLWTVAATGEAARTVLLRMASELGAQD
ncbi:helix-turn-helix transcriptional regulator [Streptomyces sp. ID05-26A]|nr:helix-turn-helix transcriptional regulator [Streptomyces sp. ID05-26A]